MGQNYKSLDDYWRGITRNPDGSSKTIELVDYWWSARVSDDMSIYRIADKLYCAYGWNGESYLKSFRVLDRFTLADEEEVELRPIYRFESDGIEITEENEDDDSLFEIVGFDVS